MRWIIATIVLVFSCMPVAAADNVRIAYNASWPPFSYGSGADVTGILPGLMTAILEDRMGLSLKNSGTSWAQAQAFVKRGRVDAMVTVATDERLTYSAANQEVVFTLTMRPTVKQGSAAAKAFETEPTIETLRTVSVCDIVGNGWAENFYKTNDVIYVVEKQVSDCLDRISNGLSDVIVQPPEVVAQAKSDLDGSLAEELTTLDHEFASMQFRLLISNKSELDASFREDFDTALGGMIADGTYSRVLSDLSGVEN